MPGRPQPDDALAALHECITQCRLCPRLVQWREEAARVKVRRFADQEYWGKPLPGFGDRAARVLLVGLAPAAHGGNRTGRMFTGDESGNWLFRALSSAGFANQPESLSRDDGLRLTDCYIVAAVRCAPPRNKPLPAEMLHCRAFLLEEIRLLRNLRVVVGLGKIGFEAALRACRDLGMFSFTTMPRFAHGAVYRFGGYTCMATYHPSQQNTFTGRLTRPMLNRVFRTVRRELDRQAKEPPKKK
jgi:uracil-DNA glycosylase family 4